MFNNFDKREEVMNIRRLKPHVVTKVWGGYFLNKKRHLNLPEDTKVGETWEISIHSDGPSISENEKLSSIYTDKQIPYLVKLIDTSDYLSVQVHPGDEYARIHENSTGKTECWLILDSKPGCGIYLGLKKGVTKEEFQKAIEDKKDMSQFLNFYEVKNGDFFFVPAGTIHAIGKDVTLAEIQQSSGITYRVWDWNRLDDNGNSRELHISKALDVINFSTEANQKDFFQVKSNLFERSEDTLLANHFCFCSELINVNGKRTINLSGKQEISSLMVLKGKVSINDTNLDQFESIVFDKQQEINIEGEAVLLAIS